ncbi:hypothetical protein DFH11DRAFT_1881891 [Phellopilus nigrolimitatus]|nr:hypothetical protein DFH11DRAFT_1881891 [Phellopilus nigrolimitatus]
MQTTGGNRTNSDEEGSSDTDSSSDSDDSSDYAGTGDSDGDGDENAGDDDDDDGPRFAHAPAPRKRAVLVAPGDTLQLNLSQRDIPDVTSVTLPTGVPDTQPSSTSNNVAGGSAAAAENARNTQKAQPNPKTTSAPKGQATHQAPPSKTTAGGLMLFVGIAHRHVRKGVFLASPPGSIASAVALTSHSGFGMFLVPYDTDVGIASKLSPLLFSLDRRSGAIVATDRPGFEFSRGDSDPSDTDMNEKRVSENVMRKRGASSSSGYLIEPFTPPSGTPDDRP